MRGAYPTGIAPSTKLWQTPGVFLALLPIASAASVAVLDFDAYAVPHEDAQFVAEQVRDTFLAERWLDPMSSTDLAETTVRGHEAELAEARENVAAGRARWQAGDAAGAAARWERAVALHYAARSDIARRAELADAAWSLAMALDGAGDPDGARVALETVARMFPGYDQTRASERPPALVETFRAAEAARLRAEPTRWAEAALAELEDTLGVDYVITGSVRSDGRLTARIYDAGALLYESSAMLTTSPPALFDPAYEAVAGELAAAVGARAETSDPRAAQEEDEATKEDEARDDDEAQEDDAPERDDTVVVGRPEEREPVERPRTSDTPRRMETDAPPRAASSSPKGAQVGAPSPRAAPRPDTEPAVTERWWFWALLFSATVGAGAAVAGWMYEPRPTVEEVPDAYTVTVVAPGA